MTLAARVVTVSITYSLFTGLGCTEAPDHADAGDADAAVEDSGPIDVVPDNGDLVCVPVCENRTCGPDGCGGSCGECGFPGAVCVDGECLCEPSCPEGGCGQDGCGGYCPSCRTGTPETVLNCDQRWTLCDETTRSCVPLEQICGPCSEGKSLCARQTLDCEAEQSADPLAKCNGGWCRIPGGLSFVMGGPTPGEGKVEWGGSGAEFEHWYPRHPVVLTRGFEIMQTEVTHDQWLKVMETATVPTRYPACGPDCPVSMATFFDVLAFANRASENSGFKPCYTLEGCNDPLEGWKMECERAIFEGPDCRGFRLPSEAEFELAAGAGVTSCFPNGCARWGMSNCDPVEDISHMAWFCGNSAVDYEGCKDCSTIAYTGPQGSPCCGSHPVGQKEPNAFGLFDMIGNVAEFTGTIMTPHPSELVVDPGFDTVIDQPVVHKGGSQGGSSTTLCVGQRNGVRLDFKGIDAGGVGFRLVRTLEDGRLR